MIVLFIPFSLDEMAGQGWNSVGYQRQVSHTKLKAQTSRRA